MQAVAESIVPSRGVEYVLASYHKTGSLDSIISKHWSKPRVTSNINKLTNLLSELRKVAGRPSVQLSALLSSLPSVAQYIFVVRWFM